ncbi:MAG: DUF3833 domain-containing protein [Desulfocapsaceae bacterium]|nr:DUF3833 domain-containing protein [Desulfocapsaceae bacterium]
MDILIKRVVIFSMALVIFAGCSAVDIKQYEGDTPQFLLYEYFKGETKGWGIVQDRKGNLLRQFVVDIKGTVNEQGELVLDEDFYWRDGEQEKRIWTIGRSGERSYTGKAADVIDSAKGEAYGNVLNWQYRLNLEVDGRTWEIHFDDWMFLQPDNVLINKAVMSKFGFKVGEITIVFLKNIQ